MKRAEPVSDDVPVAGEGFRVSVVGHVTPGCRARVGLLIETGTGPNLPAVRMVVSISMDSPDPRRP